MRRFLRFFTTGPGAVLVVIVIALTVAFYIYRGQQKQRAEANKRQVQRALGQVRPSAPVDQSQASKEVILSRQRLNPPPPSEAPTPMPVSFATPGPQRVALPTLVSFYAQVAATPSPTPEAPPEPKAPLVWLPPSIFIPCSLVNTVESSHINTPVVGEVTRDVIQNNDGVSHVIVPAGTLVSSFAQSGAVRDRIEVAGVWLFVYPDGRTLRVPGMACVREADPTNQQFGLEDGSAGLQGEIVESDHWASAKALLALLITTSVQTGTAVATSAIQAQHTTGVLQVPDTTPIMAKYIDQLLNGETGDGRFVRVRASTEFYIFPTQTILPTHRSVTVNEGEASGAGNKTEPNSAPTIDRVLKETLEAEQQLLRASQQPTPIANEAPKFKY
jgi:type F conjugative transfer system protein TrbI